MIRKLLLESVECRIDSLPALQFAPRLSQDSLASCCNSASIPVPSAKLTKSSMSDPWTVL